MPARKVRENQIPFGLYIVGLDQALGAEPRDLERHAHGQFGVALLAPEHRRLRWQSPGDRAANEGSAGPCRNPARNAAGDVRARRPPTTRTRGRQLRGSDHRRTWLPLSARRCYPAAPEPPNAWSNEGGRVRGRAAAVPTEARRSEKALSRRIIIRREQNFLNLANFAETRIFDRYIKLIYNALNHPELLSDELRAIQGMRRLRAYKYKE